MSSIYNIGAKYEITGRIIKGTSVTAYMMKDRTTDEISISSKDIVEQMALNKQIYNCKAQLYNGIVNLRGIECKISRLPRYNESGELMEETKHKKKVIPDLEIIGKLHKSRVVSDYIIITIGDASKKMQLDKETVVQLAQEGRILNVKVQMNNGEPIMRGINGFNLAKITNYQLES